MKHIKNNLISTAIFITSIFLSQALSAHVMVAQHGTLNVLEKGAFMVLSLPISAFEGIDDDNDGKLSNTEFNRHRNAIAKVIHNKIVLKDEQGVRVLEDMMLSPVVSHDSPNAPVSQLVVMGRYSLTNLLSPLEYTVEIFGTSPTENSLDIVATRKSDHKKQRVKLTPKNPSVSIF
ncbi:hypothetical protein L3081_13340 [Colwellia sp. MSW7]|uniref:EF-hand domain-containing protein n=1 Tax=Colwellia maritima TaxID=2912588 RepID=A0ABS9X1Y6_9GAMM|nr:hypothetical protein [Colwellia maritima]MCI2284184.1 hypothetical protein [Colwellia maritima]